MLNLNFTYSDKPKENWIKNMKLIQLQKEINPKSNQQIKVFYVQEISPVSETSTPKAVGQELNLEKDW